MILIKTKRIAASVLVVISCVLFTNIPTVSVRALSQDQVNTYDSGINFFDTNTSSCSTTVSDTGGSLDAWMQAEAILESNNDPTANSGDGAYGKYQIIPSTWHGYAAAYYPPALQYATANLAPVNIQDALVYLENLTNYKNFGGDPFWLAVHWYYPADDHYYPNKNAPALNEVPDPGAGNTTTVADYGNAVAGAISSGSIRGTALSSVTLSYSSAPDFSTYLSKDGGAPSGTPTVVGSAVSSGCESSSASATSCTLVGSGQAVTGPNAGILCEAEKYNGIYYNWGGGHGYTAFRAACPENAISAAAQASTIATPGPCATDCSGLVSVAVDAVYAQTFSWAVSNDNGQMEGSNPQYWQSIPISQAQAGDIVTTNNGDGNGTPDGHVEIVEYVNGSSVYTFGSHSPETRTSGTEVSASYWNEGAWRYVGPGSAG